MKRRRVRHRVRLSGILVFLGLLVEGLTLFSDSPVSFLIFAGAGVVLVGGGVGYFLWILATTPIRLAEESPP